MTGERALAELERSGAHAAEPVSPPAGWSAMRVAVLLAAIAVVLFLSIPLLALVRRTLRETGGISEDTWQVMRQALSLTLFTSVISLLVIILFGTPLAYLLARRSFTGKAVVEALVDLPMVLPPAVAGLALLMAFGRRGIIGQQLDDWGIGIAFTPAAVILAQIFVAIPFFVRATRAGFARIERDLEEAASDLGATPWQVFRGVTLPLARAGLAAGAVLAWARAVGEFGATILFAGNIAGRTQTMPLAIYGRFEAGDLETALLLSVTMMLASFLVLVAVRLVSKEE